MKIKDQPRRLLAHVRGLELREMEAADECCGFGGTFSVKWGELSSDMLGGKIEAIRATGAGAVVSIDPSWPQANLSLSWYYMFSEQMHDALKAVQTAIRQEPNSYFAKVHLGGCLAFLGDTVNAFEVLKSIEDSGRRDPWRWLWFMHRGTAQFSAGLFSDVVETCSAGKQIRPTWPGFYTLSAAAEAHMGNKAKAEENVRGMLTCVPRMSLLGISRYPMFVLDKDIDNLVDGLRMAGLPETPTT